MTTVNAENIAGVVATRALHPKRIAELAASGKTNRAVAEAAFVSPKTVEANLARVYRKLRISSRAELGAWMAAESAGAESET